jgi:hypothetical protein
MLVDPKNGDLVQFWRDTEDEVGYVDGIIDVAIPVTLTFDGQPIIPTYRIRIISDSGEVVEMYNNEVTPLIKFINVYEVERCYGGPEEGGWWYDVGEPVASVPYANEHDGQRIRHEMKQMYPRSKGQGRYSVFGGPDYEVYSEDQFARPFPKERPHYE